MFNLPEMKNKIQLSAPKNSSATVIRAAYHYGLILTSRRRLHGSCRILRYAQNNSDKIKKSFDLSKFKQKNIISPKQGRLKPKLVRPGWPQDHFFFKNL